ncbi:sushi, von Willebrand factor type A, EGF and pentraxin domain-containing protein 1-like [Haliotis rufescens]|uniref:sushi, von Willebrand factor type A, EGF and pentraxin domain-containing protein 1-like n=1 Tax=Haliotis rufescens TaxID=6454 RepID=UPI00201EF322|nr:sushi, von Willebrand factor type A, EGF and pentraxin domain-containing protein 1-like [Haliotis rufescens]
MLVGMLHVIGIVLCLLYVCPVNGQRSRLWEVCACKWSPWGSWSMCTRKCWGVQLRQRQVWKKNTPQCKPSASCDGGVGARQLQYCNKQCTGGEYVKEKGKKGRCKCPPGLYGDCCDQVVSCGMAPAILNANLSEATYNYSDVIRYDCNHGYRLNGTSEVMCDVSGNWNGTLPECIAEDPCKGVTCPLGESCRPEGTSYTCNCPKNARCNLDLAPEVESCPPSKNITTPDRTVLYKWDLPKFKDAAGEQLQIEANYPSNEFRFPWGNRTIQYTAIKKSNGQRAICEFSIDVRPIPCPELSAPNRGVVVCTNWRSAYGKFCLVSCTEDYELPEDYDARQWLVCGSSGDWMPSNIPEECSVMFGDGNIIQEGALQKIDGCLHAGAQEGLRTRFLRLLRESAFKSFCTNYEDMCRPENVEVICWNNQLLG